MHYEHKYIRKKTVGKNILQMPVKRAHHTTNGNKYKQKIETTATATDKHEKKTESSHLRARCKMTFSLLQ